MFPPDDAIDIDRTSPLSESPSSKPESPQRKAPAHDEETVLGRDDSTRSQDRPLQPEADLSGAGSLSGFQVGEYLIGEELGQGGMGTVYRAEHRRLKRAVALKVLRSFSEAPAEIISRFSREIELVARLQHPNIVGAYDASESNGVPYLVLELVEGRNLHELVQKRRTLSIKRVLSIASQAAEALAVAHEAGVLHRDVKPSNFLIDRQGRVKLLDLGLARLHREDADLSARESDHLTVDSRIMGTVAYMAPEQAVDIRSIDHRADIYSLGCTLHFLLTGQTVYTGETMMKHLLAHQTQPVPKLRDRREDVPEPLDALFQRMLAKVPEDRPGTMREVLNELNTLRRESSEASSTVIVPEPVSPPQPPSRWSRSTALLVAAAASIIVLLGVFLLRLTTPEGVLVIKSSQSELSLAIDGKETYHLTDPADGKPVRIQLPHGKHELVISKTGFKTTTRSFTLNPDDPVHTVEISLEPLRASTPAVTEPVPPPPPVVTDSGKPVQPSPPPAIPKPPVPVRPDSDAHRRFAEVVLSKGGSFTADLGGRFPTNISTRNDVPAGAFEIQGVSISRANLSAEDTLPLLSMPSVKYLDLGGCSITPQAAANLVGLPRLESLTLGRSDFDDDCAAVLRQLPSLKQLHLGQTKVTAAGLRGIGTLRNLNTLQLQLLPATDETLAEIGQLTNLETLYVTGSKITDEGVGQLTTLRKLTSLHLSSNEIGNEALRTISRLKGLTHLGIENTKVTDSGLGSLSALTNLTTLSLRSCPIDGSRLDAITSLPKLRSLSLEFTEVTDAHLRKLIPLGDSLEMLHLSATSIGDDSVETFVAMKSLRFLSLSQSQVTTEGVEMLQKQKPMCRIVP